MNIFEAEVEMLASVEVILSVMKNVMHAAHSEICVEASVNVAVIVS